MSSRIAREESIKQMRLMDHKNYIITIMKCLRDNINASIVDKITKKLTKVPKGPNIFEKEIGIYRSIVMGSPKINYLIEIMVRNQAYDEFCIFRKSISQSEYQEVKLSVEECYKNPDLVEFDPKITNHHLAYLLKQLLNEFEDSLFPSRYIQLYYELGSIEDEKVFTESLQLINMLIPIANTKILKNLLKLLHMVIKSPKSSLNSQELAKMFMPCLFSMDAQILGKGSGSSKRQWRAKPATEDIVGDINYYIGILARIINCGLLGFKNSSRAETDLISAYNKLIREDCKQQKSTRSDKRSGNDKLELQVKKNIVTPVNWKQLQHQSLIPDLEAHMSKKNNRLQQKNENPLNIAKPSNKSITRQYVTNRQSENTSMSLRDVAKKRNQSNALTNYNKENMNI
ncbi:MAG: hypothetical protein MHMPM18_001308 [Marteilia pararefringens]